MDTTMIKQHLKTHNFPTNSQQPHLGIQNLYLSQRVLRVPPDYLSSRKQKPNCYLSSVTFKARSETIRSLVIINFQALDLLLFF